MVNERDKRFDAIFAQLRKLDERLATNEGKTSALRRDVDRIERKANREAEAARTLVPGNGQDKPLSIWDTLSKGA